MLQWMGGSRRKVTTSRKSTHKRQRQFFEQKRRQKHTTGLDDNADEANTYFQYREKPKSLDILSLLNLATDAAAVNSGCTNATETPVLRVSPVNYQLSRETTTEGPVLRVSPVNYQLSKETSPVRRVSPVNHQLSKETRAKSSGQDEENVPPKKMFSSDPHKTTSSHKHSSNKNGDKLDCWKTTSENQLSFLDLLGDDGSNGNSEGSPVHESHVAFSVEGLGKTKMETPVHSPQQQCRVFFNGCPSPPKAAKRHHPSNKYMMEDLEFELNAVLHDIDMPLGQSSFALPFNSGGIRDNLCNVRSNNLAAKDCMPLDGDGCRTDSYFTNEGCLYNNLEDKRENTWNARCGFLDEDSPDERTFDAPLKYQPFEMDYSSADFFRQDTYDMHDFAFEGPYLRNKRNVKTTQWEFKILESNAPYFKHLPSEKENSFFTLDGMRCPPVDLNWGFNQSTWSYSDMEDTKDNMSLLSEESSSSTAVRGEKAKHSTRNSMNLGDGARKHGSEFSWSQANIYSTKNRCADEIHRVENLKESGKHTRVMKLSRAKPDCHSKEFSKVKELAPKYSSLFEEEYTSVDVESGLDSFNRRSLESNTTSLEWRYGSEDLFGAYSEPKLCKRPRPDISQKCSPSFSFQKAVFQQPFSPGHYDPNNFSITESSSRKPDTSQFSRTEGEPLSSFHFDSQGDPEFPVLSRQENDGRECEGKSECRQTDCGNFPEPEKEVSVGNNGCLSGIERPMDDASYKDTNSECEETKDETPELIEKTKTRDSSELSETPELIEKTKTRDSSELSETPELIEKIKTRDSSELSEQTSLTTKEIPDKLEISINDKKYHFDAGFRFPSQSGSKGKENNESEKSSGSKGHKSSKEPSYLVMLESYVLQLLCVQKVLKEEASQQDPVRKV